MTDRLSRRELISYVVGGSIVGTMLVHVLRHGEWGRHDWGVVAIVTLGLGIMFNTEVTNIIREWRGRKD
jgi:hypothetical protein